MLLLTGSASPTLALNIAQYLNLSLTNVSIDQFSDGESHIEILENVRGQDVFIIQPTSTPPNHHLIELILINDAIRRAKARRIIAIIPYLSYARQDKCLYPIQAPLGAKVIADLLATCKFNRILTIDPHSEQLQGFFSTPFDSLYSTALFVEDILKKNHSRLAIVSPDIGGVKRARTFAQQLNVPLFIIDKQRSKSNNMQAINIIGDIKGHDCIIVDDIIDTANTICQAASILKEKGAQKVIAYATHPVLSGQAIHAIQSSLLDELIVTNTIPLDVTVQSLPNIRVLNVAPLLAKEIEKIYQEL